MTPYRDRLNAGEYTTKEDMEKDTMTAAKAAAQAAAQKTEASKTPEKAKPTSK